ncbi:hypothetical protein NQ318_018078 [Aromia moschata]|uniref:Uncharacterized protein n=1 Tax=Aromia moschata TaxID=1265417 RepID=A0AAV8ZDY2_9CUCU|nr:hypothetical protein NQ318_018078 [Aromia moschata]
MKTVNSASVNIDNYRKLVQTYIDLHVYGSALFWADKVVALTGNPRDVYWLAQCMYLSKQYHRAAHLLRSRNLEKQAYSSFLLLKGKVLEAMDNRGLASDCYKQALHTDVYCFEAFDSLIKYQMLTAAEVLEEELLNSLPVSEQCSSEEAEILITLYESKLKKYHTPTISRPHESKILFGNTPNVTNNKLLNIMHLTPEPIQSLPTTPLTLVTPPSISTPNVARNNDKNLLKSELKKE